MGQRPSPPSGVTLFAVAILAALACAACERKSTAGAARAGEARETGSGEPAGAARRAAPTVASLSPAATDILLGVGAADHLVAVSNYDPGDNPAVAGLPRVGDYRTQDWEKLAALRPAKMVVQLHPDRTPAGLRDRAKGLGIELVNVQIDTLDDVLNAIPRLAEASGEPEKGRAALEKLKAQLDTVRHRVAAAPKVRTLVVVDVGGRSVAGPGTFLHDILTIAGGENAAADLGNAWPTVDREKIAQLRPEVVIHLLPAAPPQVLAQAKQFWAAMPDLPAVKNQKVHYLTDSFVLLPGYRLGDLAEQFALVLHPFANVGPLDQRLKEQGLLDPPRPATGGRDDSSSPSR
jgi:iron complex transport system substrate-binding protein